MTNSKKTSVIRQRLQDREAELRADIQRELRKYDDDRTSMLADRVADLGDQSLLHLLSDIDLAEVTRDVEEYREIVAALVRLDDLSYGTCVGCGEQIDPDRLDANPSAARCIDCQSALERQDRETHIRTL
jgi:DnaK suppressor protein